MHLSGQDQRTSISAFDYYYQYIISVGETGQKIFVHKVTFSRYQVLPYFWRIISVLKCCKVPKHVHGCMSNNFEINYFIIKIISLSFVTSIFELCL